MMRKFFAIILCLILALTLFVGCVKGDEGISGNKDIVPSGKTIRVGVMTGNASAVPNYRAIEEGYYKDLGINVKVYDFANGVLINEAFAAGELDMALNGFASAYSMATGEYVYLGDSCVVKGHGIWVRPDSPLLSVKGEYSKDFPNIYGSKQTAKGLKVFCQLGAITQIMVDSYMETLGNEDYSLIGMDVGASLNALIAGEGDAGVFFPPFSSQAKAAGLVEIGQYDEICGGSHNEILMTTEEMFDKRYGDVILFMKGYYKAAAELEADEDLFYQDGMELFAFQGTAYSDKDMRDLMSMRTFFTKEEFSKENYEYGYHLSFTMSALIELGKLKESSIEVYKNSCAPETIKEVLGVDVKLGFYE